jgi:transcriptional regulator with PAS, ATPase and Fis domain
MDIDWRRFCPELENHGLRLGDQWQLKPVCGRLKKMALSRTGYWLKLGEGHNVEMSPLKIEGAEFFMKLIGTGEDGRYMLQSLESQPFCHNGRFSYSSYLQRGDELALGFNRVELKGPEIEETYEVFSFSKKMISILIQGETGTGKGRLARMIHEQSERQGRFVHVNASAFSRGLLESELFGHVRGAFTGAICEKKGAIQEAHRGTLFLDEIDSLPLEIQLKLLLFLDNKQIRPVGGNIEREVDCRLIFASGRNLEDLVRLENIRKDFYYRVGMGVVIDLPSLRHDKEKLKNLLDEFERERGVVLSAGLRDYYLALSWPGNIRQLWGHLEMKLSFSSGRRLEYCERDKRLSSDGNMTMTSEGFMQGRTLQEMKEEHVYRTFTQMNRRVLDTAKALGINKGTVRSLVQGHLDRARNAA